MRDIAQQVLDDVLTGKAWENSEEAVWTVTITDTIKNKLKGVCILERGRCGLAWPAVLQP